MRVVRSVDVLVILTRTRWLCKVPSLPCLPSLFFLFTFLCPIILTLSFLFLLFHSFLLCSCYSLNKLFYSLICISPHSLSRQRNEHIKSAKTHPILPISLSLRSVPYKKNNENNHDVALLAACSILWGSMMFSEDGSRFVEQFWTFCLDAVASVVSWGVSSLCSTPTTPPPPPPAPPAM